MKRRDLLKFASSSLASLPIISHSQSTQFTSGISALQSTLITSGPFAGGYLVAPGGYLNWYFANLGLYPFVSQIPLTVKNYLNLYLSFLYYTNTIKYGTDSSLYRYTTQDVEFDFSSGSPVFSNFRAPDSNDSYAATFLSLAVKYVTVTNDVSWWNTNLATLKSIAYWNLVVAQKPTTIAPTPTTTGSVAGLTRALQNIPINSSNTSGPNGYLMDNCEVYRGLKDFADKLYYFADGDAPYYMYAANNVRQAVNYLYTSNTQSAFRPVDINANAGLTFYADCAPQIFPQAFGVLDPNQGHGLSDIAGYASKYTGGQAYLDSKFANWPACNVDDGNPTIKYPWMVIGYVAALRGDTLRAQAQVNQMISLFSSNRSSVTINEIGFYQRTVNKLNGVV